jgi:hypothetical protein
MPELSINDVVTAHSTWLLTQPGVTGFGVGESGGEPCIVVYVDTQQGSDTIPKSLDGYPVKMVTSGPFEALE